MAVTINGVWAVLIALRYIMARGSAARLAKEVFGGAQVGNILGEFLKVHSSFLLPQIYHFDNGTF